MKRYLLPLVAIFAALPAPSMAFTLLPNIHAETFCSMRAAGVEYGDAIKVAFKESMITGDEWTMVTLKSGKQIRSDYLQSFLAVQSKCPKYLP